MNMNMNIDLKLRSLIVGIGPKECGKTYFFKNAIVSKIRSYGNYQPKIMYLSSEEQRRELLDDYEHKYNKNDVRMNRISGSVFKIINTKIEESLAHDIDYVFVDTSGSVVEFQKEMKNFASKFKYNLYFIIFDYKNRVDYFKYSTDKKETEKHVTRFKKDVLRSIIPINTQYEHKIYIRSFIDDIVLNISDYQEHVDQYLDINKKYIVIKNIKYKKFLELLSNYDIEIKDTVIVSNKYKYQIYLLFSADHDSYNNFLKNENVYSITKKRIYVPCVDDNNSMPFIIDNIDNIGKEEAWIGGFNIKWKKNLIRKEIEIDSEKIMKQFQDLNPIDYKRICDLVKYKINYISGTISPVDKSNDNNSEFSLEDPIMGMQYYYNLFQKTKKNDSLSIETKYMGSRLQFYYFHNNPDKCYVSTRNGYSSCLSKVAIVEIYRVLHDILKKYIEENDILGLIIDGEIMPWSLFGNRLINKEFMPTYNFCEKELDYLKESGFYEEIDKTIEMYSESGFANDKNTMKTSDLVKKYSHYQTFRSLNSPNIIPNYDVEKKGIEIYKKQLDLFGKDSPTVYKPFSILKIIKKDGEFLPSDLGLTQSDIFKIVGDVNDQITIDFNDQYENNIIKLKDFYNKVTKINNCEGIVIKPNILDHDINFAPYLKARNVNYLHIIYGHDLMAKHKYEKLLEKKNIRNKINLSITEYIMGIKMLSVKSNDISLDNYEYLKYMMSFLDMEQNEKKLDVAL